MSFLCRDLFGDVGSVSGLVRRCRVIVAMCSVRSALCRDLFGEVGLVAVRVRRGQHCVGIYSEMSG